MKRPRSTDIFSAIGLADQGYSCVRPPDGRYLVINMKYPMDLPVLTQLRLVKNNGWRMITATAMASALAMIAQPLPGQVKPSVGLINPHGVAFNPANGKAYTVDSRRGAVDISDDATGSTVHVKVGAGPVSIAVNAANGMAYVANGDDGTVSVLDGKTDQVVATLPATNHPYAIAVNGVTGKVYVSRTYSNEITVIDGATNTPTGVKTGSPDFIGVNTKANKVYLLGYEGGNVTVLD